MNLQEKITWLKFCVTDAEKHDAKEITFYIDEVKSVIKAFDDEKEETPLFWHCSECGYEYNCFHWLTCLLCHSKRQQP